MKSRFKKKLNGNWKQPLKYNIKETWTQTWYTYPKQQMKPHEPFAEH